MEQKRLLWTKILNTKAFSWVIGISSLLLPVELLCAVYGNIEFMVYPILWIGFYSTLGHMFLLQKKPTLPTILRGIAILCNLLSMVVLFLGSWMGGWFGIATFLRFLLLPFGFMF